LGLAVAVAGLIGFAVQILLLRAMLVPWYAPVLGTAGTGLLVWSLLRAWSIPRIIAVVLIGLLTGFEWYTVAIGSKLPDYKGPVRAGDSLPAFATTLADGSPFTQDNLKGDQNTVLVFFRGRW
jgi:hypothetical protein